jgi:hypothetical protein
MVLFIRFNIFLQIVQLQIYMKKIKYSRITRSITKE